MRKRSSSQQKLSIPLRKTRKKLRRLRKRQSRIPSVSSKELRNQRKALPSTRNSTIVHALFPATRGSILAAILIRPEKWWYLSELAAHVGTVPSSLQRELSSLVQAGILEQRRDGARCYFRPGRSAILGRLRGIFASSQQAVSKAARQRRAGRASVGRKNIVKPSGARIVQTIRPLKGTTGSKPLAQPTVIYPRPKVKAVLVEAARRRKLTLSSFILLAGLKWAARVLRRPFRGLVPRWELEEYLKSRA